MDPPSSPPSFTSTPPFYIICQLVFLSHTNTHHPVYCIDILFVLLFQSPPHRRLVSEYVHMYILVLSYVLVRVTNTLCIPILYNIVCPRADSIEGASNTFHPPPPPPPPLPMIYEPTTIPLNHHAITTTITGIYIFEPPLTNVTSRVRRFISDTCNSRACLSFASSFLKFCSVCPRM